MNYKNKLIIIMCGLPARGKSYTAFNIMKYFNWIGYNTKIFNVGDYRRKKLGGFQDSSFFSNEIDKIKIRESIAIELYNLLIDWIINIGDIAIFDATNTTLERRKNLINISNDNKIGYIFVENICNINEIINMNYSMKMKSSDYKNINPEIAKKDFKNRLNYYKENYIEINNNEENIRYIKKNNNYVELFDIQGLLQKKLVNYLIRLKINKNPIYLTRHGESLYNISNKIGGNSDLSKLGLKYSEELYKFIISENEVKNYNLKIYTSLLKRTIQTSSSFDNRFDIINLKQLNEIDAGVCEHFTYDEIKSIYPYISSEREKNKFKYRYPNGESYEDLIKRLEDFILEIEDIDTPVLIITHNAIARIIYSYLMNEEQDKIPYINIPLNTIFKFTPTSNGYTKYIKKLV